MQMMIDLCEDSNIYQKSLYDKNGELQIVFKTYYNSAKKSKDRSSNNATENWPNRDEKNTLYKTQVAKPPNYKNKTSINYQFNSSVLSHLLDPVLTRVGPDDMSTQSDNHAQRLSIFLREIDMQQCWDLLRTHIFPRTRELPQFPISPKPLFLSKNRLRNPPKRSYKKFLKNFVFLSGFETKQKTVHICTKKKFAHMQNRINKSYNLFKYNNGKENPIFKEPVPIR
ncbi:hypothetical protein LXL04_010121 [Taraxacum kok-saghyz]